MRDRKGGPPPGEFAVSVDGTSVEDWVLGKAGGVSGHAASMAECSYPFDCIWADRTPEDDRLTAAIR